MKTVILSASKTRSNLYNIIKSTGLGLRKHIIKLRGVNLVVLVNQEEYESLKETAKILSIAGSLENIRQGEKEMRAKKGIPLENLK
jgi:PHD/YefM family antitoxin component YafN of YafNO toxin-antitoxin module